MDYPVGKCENSQINPYELSSISSNNALCIYIDVSNDLASNYEQSEHYLQVDQQLAHPRRKRKNQLCWR